MVCATGLSEAASSWRWRQAGRAHAR
jgi:hypothetical protein